MTESTLRPPSTASIACSWPGRSASKPNTSRRICCLVGTAGLLIFHTVRIGRLGEVGLHHAHTFHLSPRFMSRPSTELCSMPPRVAPEDQKYLGCPCSPN